MTTADHSGKSSSRQSLPQRVAAQLKERIVAGVYPLGSYLPSLRDLEQEFGVSRRSVSGAIEQLQAMGLVICRQGRGTEVVTPGRRAGSTGQVLLLCDSLTNGSMEQRHLTAHIVASLGAFGYDCVHQEYDDLPDDLDAALAPYAGVLFQEAGAQHYADLALRIEKMRFPVVVANLEIDTIAVAHTCLDHHRIGRDATNMMLDFGHRRIGFVGRTTDRYFYGKYLAGYRDALAEAGIAEDPALIDLQLDPPALAGYRGALRMLTLDDPPTAFVAARDWYAQGVWTAAEEAGLRVGHDISLIGFDDLTWYSEAPQLTTFREPIDALAKEAAQMLLDRMVSGWTKPQRRVLDAPLALRRSAGPCLREPNNRVDQSRRQLAASLLGIDTL